MLDLAHVEVEQHGHDVVATIHGEVDLSNADRVAEALDTAFGNRARHCVVDLSFTEHLDSIGIHLLFSLAESLRTRRQELRLVVPPSSRINRLLELVDMKSVIRIDTDRASALR